MADGRTDFPLSVGERLQQARLAQKLSLEDIATHTRVPARHLDAIERGDWVNLPAPTYSIGFAKAFADVVGLDRKEVGDDLRAEMGGARAPVAAATETFQPADPARVPPRMLAIVAVLIGLVLLASYGYYRSVALGDAQPQIGPTVADAETSSSGASSGVAADVPTTAPLDQSTTPPPVALAASAGGPVVITATEEVWLQIYERGGATLTTATLAAGQSYEVPAAAADPLLRTARADLLRVTVGGAAVGPVGPANRVVKDISLRPAALTAVAAPPAQP